MRISPVSTFRPYQQVQNNQNAPKMAATNNYMSTQSQTVSFNPNFGNTKIAYFTKQGKKLSNDFIDKLKDNELFEMARNLYSTDESEIKLACGYKEPGFFEKLLGDPCTPERVKALSRAAKIQTALEKVNAIRDKLIAERDAMIPDSKEQRAKQDEIEKFLRLGRINEDKDGIQLHTEWSSATDCAGTGFH